MGAGSGAGHPSRIGVRKLSCIAPFAAAIAADFLLKERVHGPFEVLLEKILGQEQPQLVGVRNRLCIIETAWPEFMSRRRRTLIVKNIADAKLHFRKEGRVERKLVPIGEGVAAFQTEGGDLKITVVSLNIGFNGKIDPPRQTDLTFFPSSLIIRAADR